MIRLGEFDEAARVGRKTGYDSAKLSSTKIPY
jgi:hypothetical protein